MRDLEVEFVTPPRPTRGGRPQRSEWDDALSLACRERPGAYAVFGSYPSDHQAESVRRRIHRGGGAWVGGRALWSVVIRKLGDDEWLVYVAFRNEAMGVAS